jgi:imidazole glycerol-phosphate synthase subunit HisH
MNIALIKYNAGNTQSVIFALERAGITPNLTNDKEELMAADKVIFPGVGEAGSTMRHLKSLGLDKILPELKQPFLGICLGMQLMCKHSEEGDTPCLNIFDLPVQRFVPENGEKVPHMGWNDLTIEEDHPLLKELPDKHMYFVHSYYVPLSPYNLASAEFIIPFCAVLHRDNFYAVQFHPEKSGEQGQKILENFIRL